MAFGGKKAASVPLWQQFFLGAVSGMIASASTHPLDLIKVRIQVNKSATADPTAQKEGILRTGVRVFKLEGLPGLYKGLTASLLRQATYTNARFGLYLTIKDHLADENGNLPTLQKILAGMLAGAGGSLVGNPADVIMVRMQADGRLPPDKRRNYKHAFDGLFRIAREEGVATLWAGTLPNLQRAMLMSAGQLATYDQVKAYFMKSKLGDGIINHFVSSTVAAFVATVITTPLDVVKTRIMNSKAGEYSGSLDCFKKTLAAEGPFAFYKGFVPFFLRLGPHTVISLIAFEQLSILMNKVMEPYRKRK